MEILKNQKSRKGLNAILWLIILAIVAYLGWNIKSGWDKDWTITDKLSVEEYRKKLKRTGPYLFWQGDSLDVHEVDAGFLQYYDAKKRTLDANEAINMSFNCYSENLGYKISFKLHSIDTPPTEYPMPEKAVLIGGGLSNFKGFRDFMVNNGIINTRFEWTFGKGHLIIHGAPSSMENIFLQWLLYKLEHEAVLAGGKIHIVLGQSPFRNLDKKMESGFSSDINFLKFNGWTPDTLVRPNTELGRWLYSKNVIEKMGDFIISANGIDDKIADSTSFQQINNIFRYAYKHATMDDYDKMTLDKSFLTQYFKPNMLYDNYRVESILDGSVVYYKYRYNKKDDPYKLSKQRIDAFLKKYNGKHIISSMPYINNKIKVVYDNKFIGQVIDENRAGGGSINTLMIRYEGLWFENNQVYLVNDEAKKELMF